MLKKVNLKKSFSIIAIAVMALVLMFAPASVQAASNPLSDMPTKISKVINDRNLNGTMFSTPIYSSKVKLSVKSSNRKVVKVTGSGSSMNYNGRKKYYAFWDITPVSPGTAKIYIKVTVGKRVYNKTCTYKVYKWENPVTTLKINSTNYKNRINKTGSVHANAYIISGKLYYKTKSGFTVKAIAHSLYGKNTTLKNGCRLPKNTVNIEFQVKSQKNRQTYTIEINQKAGQKGN